MICGFRNVFSQGKALVTLQNEVLGQMTNPLAIIQFDERSLHNPSMVAACLYRTKLLLIRANSSRFSMKAQIDGLRSCDRIVIYQFLNTFFGFAIWLLEICHEKLTVDLLH